jgi:hypothetical protein
MFPIQACVNKPKLTLFRSTYLNTMIMLPPKKRAKIIAALIANPNASAVARLIGGVSNVTVWKIAKQTGVKLAAGKAARRTLPPKKRAKIIAALKANPNASAVARLLGGMRCQTVWGIAKHTGIDLTAGKAARGNRRAKRTAAAISDAAHRMARRLGNKKGSKPAL